MKVYLVYTGEEYEEKILDRIFSSRDAAIAYCSYHKGVFYEELETESDYSPSDPYRFVEVDFTFNRDTKKLECTSCRTTLFDHDEPGSFFRDDQIFFSPESFSIHKLLPVSLYPTEKDAIDFVKSISDKIFYSILRNHINLNLSDEVFKYLATQKRCSQEYIINDFLKNKVY